jgi:hypothetical protein
MKVDYNVRLIVIDSFCGAGGVTEGFHRAEIAGHKVCKVIIGINHEATILSLGTYKRVEKEFPEAYAVIPQRYTNPEPVQTIALPIDDLKAELLKYSK